MGKFIDAYQNQDKHRLELIQELWAGYGKIYRINIHGESFILKHYQMPGMLSKLSAKQKMKWDSFKHERTFYLSGGYASIRTPKFIESQTRQGEVILLLEDLSIDGFVCGARKWSQEEFNTTINFLAKLHASTIHETEDKVWAGYWALEKRQAEWASMASGPLKERAEEIDLKLKSAQYQCLLHGDAKPANYGFKQETSALAAFDFQYWGRGIGPMDIACYFSGVLHKEVDWNAGFEIYMAAFEKELAQIGIPSNAIKQEWRQLWPYCVADYFRFLQGWMPKHRKLSGIPINIIAKVC